MDTSLVELVPAAQNATPRTYARSRSRTATSRTPLASPAGTPSKLLAEAIVDLYVQVLSCSGPTVF